MNDEAIIAADSGEVLGWYCRDLLTGREIEQLTDELESRRADFKNGFMLVGDRWVKTPRLVAEYGDGSFVFPDTGPNNPWPPRVHALRDRLTPRWGSFNYALANLYRNGRDFTGWHTDKMDLHIADSVIAMVSVGAARPFVFRSTVGRSVVAELEVRSGSLLVMLPASQRGYEHSVPPQPCLTGSRISLTFRHLAPTDQDCGCSEKPPARQRHQDSGQG